MARPRRIAVVGRRAPASVSKPAFAPGIGAEAGFVDRYVAALEQAGWRSSP